jgi:hypothetical protein
MKAYKFFLRNDGFTKVDEALPYLGLYQDTVGYTLDTLYKTYPSNSPNDRGYYCFSTLEEAMLYYHDDLQHTDILAETGLVLIEIEVDEVVLTPPEEWDSPHLKEYVAQQMTLKKVLKEWAAEDDFVTK